MNDGAKEFYPFTVECLVLKENDHLLDLGAGTGLELKAILKLYPDIKVTCIDLANEMLKKLKENIISIR